MLVHDDAEWDTIEACDNATIEFGRSAVDGDGVALPGITHGFDTMVQQQLEHRTLVIRRAANDEVPRCLAPHLLQPFQIGLEAPGSCHKSLGAELGGLPIN